MVAYVTPYVSVTDRSEAPGGMMADDHFEQFMKGLDNARAQRKPTKADAEKRFSEQFEELLQAQNRLNKMLEEKQPSSFLSRRFPAFDPELGKLELIFSATRSKRDPLEIEFWFRDTLLHAQTPDFKGFIGDRKPIWRPEEQGDLIKSITNYFGRYFGSA